MSATSEHAVPGTYWDGVFEHWVDTPAHRLWRAHSDALNRQLLRRWLPEGIERLLKTDLFDEAVAEGLYPELADKAERVVGIDVSAAVVRAASDRYPGLEAQVGDVLEPPFADESFDVVVSNSTLDHFDSRSRLQRAVGQLTRLLRPGGWLLITLDNRMNPVVALRTSRLRGLLHRLGVVPYTLGTTCGPRGLVELLGNAGLEVTRTDAIMHCPPRIAAELAVRRAQERGGPPTVGRHLDRVLRYESLGRWPTRNLTAHFIAAMAVKPCAA